MNRFLKIRRKGGRSKAQGMVEFALALPVVLMLMLGIIEAGRLLVAYSAVYTASREAVRYGTANGVSESGRLYFQDCTGMRQAAVRVGRIGGVRPDDVDIRYDHGLVEEAPAYNTLQQCNESAGYPSESNVALGDRVIVRVTTKWNPIIPMIVLPVIDVSSTTARTVIRNVDVMGTPLPSPTLKKTYTPTMAYTSTYTFTPSPTRTYTLTPSLTPTETEGPSPTPTNTYTPTLTRTITPSPSITLTRTPTSTLTPTETPTPTATPRACAELTVVEDHNRLPSNKFSLELQNMLTEPVNIRSVSISWSGGSQMTSILYNNDTVWAGSAPSPQQWIPSALYPVPLQQNKNQPGTATLGFTFSSEISSAPIVAVIFDNNCIVAYLP